MEFSRLEFLADHEPPRVSVAETKGFGVVVVVANLSSIWPLPLEIVVAGLTVACGTHHHADEVPCHDRREMHREGRGLCEGRVLANTE